jgi:hypothetical protein
MIYFGREASAYFQSNRNCGSFGQGERKGHRFQSSVSPPTDNNVSFYSPNNHFVAAVRCKPSFLYKARACGESCWPNIRIEKVKFTHISAYHLLCLFLQQRLLLLLLRHHGDSLHKQRRRKGEEGEGGVCVSMIYGYRALASRVGCD